MFRRLLSCLSKPSYIFNQLDPFFGQPFTRQLRWGWTNHDRELACKVGARASCIVGRNQGHQCQVSQYYHEPKSVFTCLKMFPNSTFFLHVVWFFTVEVFWLVSYTIKIPGVFPERIWGDVKSTPECELRAELNQPGWSSSLLLKTSMPVQRSLQASKKQPTPHHLDFICVGGWYRVGKLLGTGGSGEPHPT